MFHRELIEWLPDQDVRFTSLVEYGFTIDRVISCCMNKSHIDSIKQGTMTKGTFENPIIMTSSYSDTAAAAAVTAAGARGDVSKFSENPAVIDQLQTEMFRTIVRCIEDEGRRKQLEKSCKRNGSLLLKHLKDERDKVAAAGQGGYGDKVLLDIRRLEKGGLSAPRTSAFNQYRTSLEQLVDILPADLKAGHPEAVVARKLVRAVRGLGGFIANKFDNRMDVTSAHGKIKETCEAATYVLDAAENDEEDDDDMPTTDSRGRGL